MELFKKKKSISKIKVTVYLDEDKYAPRQHLTSKDYNQMILQSQENYNQYLSTINNFKKIKSKLGELLDEKK